MSLIFKNLHSANLNAGNQRHVMTTPVNRPSVRLQSTTKSATQFRQDRYDDEHPSLFLLPQPHHPYVSSSKIVPTIRSFSWGYTGV
jgi:hypothetical protein